MLSATLQPAVIPPLTDLLGLMGIVKQKVFLFSHNSHAVRVVRWGMRDNEYLLTMVLAFPMQINHFHRSCKQAVKIHLDSKHTFMWWLTDENFGIHMCS